MFCSRSFPAYHAGETRRILPVRCVGCTNARKCRNCSSPGGWIAEVKTGCGIALVSTHAFGGVLCDKDEKCEQIFAAHRCLGGWCASYFSQVLSTVQRICLGRSALN